MRKHYVSYQCFPVCPPRETLLRKQNWETKFASQEAKMFPNKFGNIFVAETMFPSLPTCFEMFPTPETLFSRWAMLKQCLKTIVQT